MECTGIDLFGGAGVLAHALGSPDRAAGDSTTNTVVGRSVPFILDGCNKSSTINFVYPQVPQPYLERWISRLRDGAGVLS